MARDYLDLRPGERDRRLAELKAIACEKGFEHCESGPLVRSSYHAESHIDRPLT